MTEREILLLGAFLHDIGKFKWRSQPIRAGDNHEKLGEEFIREELGRISVLKPHIEKIIEMANRHHSSIRQADYSSASERIKDSSNLTRRPLISIFSKVNINKGKDDYFNKGVYYYLPNEFNTPVTEENITYEDWKINDEDLINQHSKIYIQFINEVRTLEHIIHFRTFFTSFYKICEKYLSNICSAGYYSRPDISLFDHSRNVAAISLSQFENEGNKNENILLKGDLSGIQKFLYHEIEEADKAAKQLRGRSFFITLLVDTVCNYFLNELDLFETNILYNSGGHFTLIIPNNVINKQKIQELEQKVNLKLLSLLGAKLQLIIGWVECSSDDLMQKFDQVYNSLEFEMQKSKKHKSLSILNELFTYHGKSQISNKIFENIGGEIPHSEYLIEIKTNSDSKISSGENIINFNEFELTYILSSKSDLENNLAKLKSSNIEYGICYNLESTKLTIPSNIIKLGLDYPLATSFRFVGNFIPFLKDRPLSFEELAKYEGNEPHGLKDNPLLGIARMDVDSLGMIFSKGLKNNEDILYSVSRTAALSRLLNYFFTKNINKIAERHKTYLVYSGGDDLFAVSSWTNIIDFVRAVREEFRKYVCNNDNLTISCGLVFVKDNYPIAKSAMMAGEEEQKAKDGDKSDIENFKDRISLFYRQVSWKLLEGYIKISTEINSILDEGSKKDKTKISRTLLYNLLTLTQQCFNRKGEFNIEKVHQLNSKLHYIFARNDVDSKEMEEKRHGFKTKLGSMFLKQDIESKKDWYKNFKIPASIVLLKTRKINK